MPSAPSLSILIPRHCTRPRRSTNLVARHNIARLPRQYCTHARGIFAEQDTIKREVRPLRQLVEKSSGQDSWERGRQRDEANWVGAGVYGSECAEYLDDRWIGAGLSLGASVVREAGNDGYPMCYEIPL
jgi:hypothetical protein